jgi:putative SOS response-associated peptidase YedK
MPIILDPDDDDDIDTWLDDDFEHARQLLKPYTQAMDKYPVNPNVVNNARNNIVDCLEQWRVVD